MVADINSEAKGPGVESRLVQLNLERGVGHVALNLHNVATPEDARAR